MSSGQGSTTDLKQGSQEAFRALISSIAPETVPERDGKLTPEAVKKLSEKLKEIVGEDAAKDFEHHRNERGELVNEEGLPIIEISEPVVHPEEEKKNEPNDQTTAIQDIPLIRLSSLPSVAREKLRQQRDRILDILEEEERQENERQERAEREEREEIVRKRKEAAVNEEGSLQKAQELQRKMGKALLHNMGSGKDHDSSPAQGGSGDHTDPSDTNHDIHKKTVTFDEPGDSVSTADNLGLGDVTAAKLRPGKGPPTLLQSFRPDSNPVKLNVIERKPTGASPGIPTLPTPFAQTARDSDDESEPGDNQYPPTSEDDESDETRAGQHTDSEEAELEDQYDLDFAQHQREIALEYYEKRNTIGQETMKAMTDHTHVEGEDEATPEVPIQSSRPKASVSRFKANRIASAYGASSHNEPSTSVAESVVPESMARTIQHAIRSGRIDDDNRLVGGEHDSDSENETQGLQETLELLKKGEVYNLGQEGHLFTAPLGTSSGGPSAGPRSTAAPQQQTAQEPQPPPLNRPKVSKFKANLSHAGRPPPTDRSITPISHADRSSPKLPSALADTVVEDKQPQSTSTTGTAPSHTSSLSPSPSITESPSLRAPRPTHPQTSVASQPFTSIVIELPSSPSYSSSSALPTPVALGSSAAFPPMIVESPSFPPAGQRSRRPERPPTVVSSQSLATGSSSKPVGTEKPVGSASVSENPRLPSTQAISPIVQERVAPQTRAEQLDHSQPKKVSRFKQARDTQL